MNLKNFTIKAQEAIQKAQELAQAYGHQQIENAHILKGIFEVDENVVPFILNKLGVNVDLFKQTLENILSSYPKVQGGDIMLSREASKTLTEYPCSCNFNAAVKPDIPAPMIITS